MALTEAEELELLELEELEAGNGQPIPESDTGKINNIAGAAVGTAVAGAAGYGAYKGAKRFNEPFALRGNLTKELQGIQKNLGIQGTELSFILDRAKEQKKNIIDDADIQSKTLKDMVDNINNKELPKYADDLAAHITSNVPDFNKSLSSGYSKGIKRISQQAEGEGFYLTSKKFSDDVIGKTINNIKSTNALPEAITTLSDVQNELGQYTKDGNILGKGMSIEEANGVVSKIINKAPNSPESAVLRNNWDNFLQSNAPESTLPDILKLNANYKEGAQLRSLLTSQYGKTGKFDNSKLTRYILDYANGKRGKDFESTMGLLINGNEITEPMKNVAPKFANVIKQSMERDSVLNKAKALTSDTATKVSEIDNLSSKSSELLSKLKEANTRIENRNMIGRIVRGVTGIKSVGLRALGPLGMVAQAGDFANNTGEALRSMSFMPTKKRTLERIDEAVKDKRMNEKDSEIQKYLLNGGI